jgi:hypothetical protein
MRATTRRLLVVSLLALVAILPACGKKNTGTTSNYSGPPPGPTGDERPPIKSDAESAAPSPPIVHPAEGVRVAPARANSNNNLKEIAIAFHNFMDTMGGGFPAGIYDASGKTVGLSWRVAILPYVEQDALYRQFKLNEPWDSPNNKKLIEKMPKLYAVQGGPDLNQGLTYYRTFAGKGTLFPPPTGGQPGGPAFGLKPQQVTDGMSNTLLVVEARDPVIWTKPDELAYDPAKPPKVGGVFGAGFNVAFCDASTRFIPKTIDEKTLRALITPNGGEVVQIP